MSHDIQADCNGKAGTVNMLRQILVEIYSDRSKSAGAKITIFFPADCQHKLLRLIALYMQLRH
jgi:hypothetical protein